MTELVSGLVGGPRAEIGFLGSVPGSQPIFGGSAGRRLMEGGFNVSVLRPCRDNPANPTNPNQPGPNGMYGDGRQVNVNATLMRDEWIQFDNVVQQVARERLVVTQSILGAGLRYALPNALGTMTLEWEQVVGDLVAAEVTMSGLNEATKDRLSFATVNMPIPIFHKEFFYNLRHLEAARRNGRNVETNHAAEATRKVAELVEATIFSGLTIAGGTIYGLTNHPNRKTVSMGTSWSTDTGANILADVRAMIDALALPPNNMEGPYNLYVARAYWANLQNDFKAESDMTILQKIEEIPEIRQVIFTNRLTAAVLLVQMTSDVLDIVDGLAPTLVEWDSHGGFQHNFKLFAIQLPRIRSSGPATDGGTAQSGICHLS